jgi:hypothetical protein
LFLINNYCRSEASWKDLDVSDKEKSKLGQSLWYQNHLFLRFLLLNKLNRTALKFRLHTENQLPRLPHWYTYQLYNTVIKLVGNGVQEFGGSCKRSALAGGKQVFDVLTTSTKFLHTVFPELSYIKALCQPEWVASKCPKSSWVVVAVGS